MLYLKNSFLSHSYPIEEADVCILGIPFDSTSINIGAKFGPLAIREALKLIEGYDSKSKVNIFEKLKIADLGDIEIVPGSYKLTAERVKETIKEIKEKNPKAFLLFFGGEHLISLPIIESLNPETVVSFDAHTDLMNEYLGKKFSHATWAYHLPKKINLVERGVRSFPSLVEEEEMKKREKRKVSGPTYLSVDIDVFDPSLAPDTSFQEIDGWHWDDFLKNLKDAKNLIAADIVEVAPQNFNSTTANLAAYVVKEILKKFLQQKG
jgi:agmatinase